jgi:hypothetical protein
VTQPTLTYVWRIKVEAIAAKHEELKLAKSSLADATTALTNFEASYNHVLTEEDFIGYAKKCVQPAFDKYNNLFLFAGDAALAQAKKAFQACKLFDVLHLKSGPSHKSLFRLIDDLIHFDFPEFDEEFRDQMKEEVPELLNLATTLQHYLEGKEVIPSTREGERTNGETTGNFMQCRCIPTSTRARTEADRWGIRRRWRRWIYRSGSSNTSCYCCRTSQ